MAMTAVQELIVRQTGLTAKNVELPMLIYSHFVVMIVKREDFKYVVLSACGH